MGRVPDANKDARRHSNYIQAGIIVLLVVIGASLLNRASESPQSPYPTPTRSGGHYVDEYDLRETITTQELWRATYEATIEAERWASVEEESSCTSWTQASRFVGSYRCLCGTVTSTYRDPQSGAFFIDFTDDRSAFYAVSFDYYWENMQDDCIRICGMVATYEGRPQIVIREPANQLFHCP
jgi:hypothetical protein